MPSPVPPEVKGRILALSAQNHSRSMIVRELGKQNFKFPRGLCPISSKTTTMALKISKSRSPWRKRTDLGLECTPDIVKKVKKYIISDDPPRQRDMARSLGTSPTFIFNIIHQDLNQQKKVTQSSPPHSADDCPA
jgi:hypothetical protein